MDILERVWQRATKMIKRLRKGWDCWDYSTRRREGSGGILINIYKCLKAGCKRREPGSCQSCPVAGQDGTNWNTLDHKKKKKKLFYCEGGWTLHQVAQRGFGASILRDIKKSTGHGPDQSALGNPAWWGQVGQDDLQRSLPAWDSVIILPVHVHTHHLG